MGLEKNNIVCLTETHQKYKNIDHNENIKIFDSMRGLKERKGGGLKIMTPSCKKIDMIKIENKNKNYLEIEGKCYGLKLTIVLVYYDVQRNNISRERNRKLTELIEERIETMKDNIIILGDFNAHIKILDGEKTDENGRLIINMIEKNNLILLNLDDKCNGKYTWRREGKVESKSAIDFVIMNEKLYKEFIDMNIDEKQEIIDLSDHNLISINIRKGLINKTKYNKSDKKIRIEYYSKNKDEVKIYKNELNKRWNECEPNTTEEMAYSMSKVMDDKLKKSFKISANRLANKEDKKWFNDEIRKEIGKRRTLNKKARNTESEREKNIFKLEYRKQKLKVKAMVRVAIEKHELEVTEEIRNSDNKGKMLWKNIEKLKGNENKNKEIEIYDKDKQKIEEKKEEGLISIYWKGIQNK
ncbi:unnamed protein product, partial [Meganyctiphanes norvegica]